MTSLIIPKDISITRLEEYYQKIYDNKYSSVRIASSGIKYGGGLGMEAAITQLIATYARHHGNLTAFTYVRDGHVEDDFKSLLNNFYGMAYLALADKILLNDGSTEYSKRKAFESSIESVEKLRTSDFTDAFKGRKVFFPCVKPSISGGKMPPLYNGSNVISSSAFEWIISKSISKLLNDAAHRVDEKTISKIAIATHQLFSNTDKHASYDTHGNSYFKDARGVTINIQAYKLEQIKEVCGNNHKATEYFENIMSNFLNEDYCSFIEISVIDSGPGFARRWLTDINKKPIDVVSKEQEIEAIIKCFKKYSSSSEIQSSGSGLNSVLLNLMALNGMFVLRTGKLVVEWFASQGTDIISEENITTLKHNAAGSVFTFLIPVLRRAGKADV